MQIVVFFFLRWRRTTRFVGVIRSDRVGRVFNLRFAKRYGRGGGQIKTRYPSIGETRREPERKTNVVYKVFEYFFFALSTTTNSPTIRFDGHKPINKQLNRSPDTYRCVPPPPPPPSLTPHSLWDFSAVVGSRIFFSSDPVICVV